MDSLLPPIDEQQKSPSVLSFFILGIICIVINFLVISFSGTNQQTVTIKINSGASTSQIAEVLEEKRVIQNAFLFKALVKQRKLDNQLKAGYYNFAPRLTMIQVLRELEEGQNHFHTVTIPEGYNLEQIATLLENKGLGKKENFLQAAQAKNFDFSFLAEAKRKKLSVEGYLFPATYRIEVDATEKDIINLMLKHFGQVVDSKFQEEGQARGLSLHEMVTLASIIEKEVKVDSERPLIAAVFLNRLDRKMLLQSCATIQYILKEPKKRLTNEDTRVASPYNTYLHSGLPPAPIASPGRSSLEAVLHPAKVDYLFFVAKGNGTHYFSNNFEEHRAAIAKIRSTKKN